MRQEFKKYYLTIINMGLEKELLELVGKVGFSKGVVIVVIVQVLIPYLKNIKIDHLKRFIKILLDKEKSKLRNEKLFLEKQLQSIKEEYDRLVIRNKRDYELNRIISTFRDMYNIGYVHITEYHNGLVNLSKDCLYRYTITYTAPHPLGFDIRIEHENQSLNRFSEVLKTMIEEGVYDSQVKDFTVTKTIRQRLGVERDIAIFLKDRNKTIFGALSISLLPNYQEEVDYIEELKLLKTEIENVYNYYRDNENTPRLDSVD